MTFVAFLRSGYTPSRLIRLASLLTIEVYFFIETELYS
jgi:hypothetical protein